MKRAYGPFDAAGMRFGEVALAYFSCCALFARRLRKGAGDAGFSVVQHEPAW